MAFDSFPPFHYLSILFHSFPPNRSLWFPLFCYWGLSAWLAGSFWLGWKYIGKQWPKPLIFGILFGMVIGLESIPSLITFGVTDSDTVWLYFILTCGFLYTLIGFALVGEKDDGEMANKTPACIVTRVTLNYAKGTDDHGIILNISGTKEESFILNQAILQVEGESFWKVLSDAASWLVSLAKWSFLPLSLCPKYMSDKDFIKDRKDFTCSIGIGTKQNGSFGAKHATVNEKLQLLVEKGDPPFTLVFHATSPTPRVMFTFATKASTMLTALAKNDHHFSIVSKPKANAPIAANEGKDESKDTEE